MPRKTKTPRAVSPAASFNSALSAAQKRLDKAIQERGAVQDKLAALNTEIPALQRTIAALNQQLGMGGQTTKADEVVKAFISPATLPDATVNVPPADLSGMGSIPASQGEPPAPVPDDESFYLNPPKQAEIKVETITVPDGELP